MKESTSYRARMAWSSPERRRRGSQQFPAGEESQTWLGRSKKEGEAQPPPLDPSLARSIYFSCKVKIFGPFSETVSFNGVVLKSP